jgi:hypothetical protein
MNRIKSILLVSVLILAGSVSARDWIDRPWKDDVIYFVMTDRFHDGDPENNVPPGSDPALYDAAQKNINLYHGGDFRGWKRRCRRLFHRPRHHGHLDHPAGAQCLDVAPRSGRKQERLPRLLGAGLPRYRSAPDQQKEPYPERPIRPEGREGRLQHYKDLIDLAHRHDIKIVQDIVCNHIGPLFYYDLDGNGDRMTGRLRNGCRPTRRTAPISRFRALGRMSRNGMPLQTARPPALFQNFDVYWAKGFSGDSLGKTGWRREALRLLFAAVFNTSPDAPHFDKLVR